MSDYEKIFPLVLSLVLVSLNIPTGHAAVDIPVWYAGSWWRLETTAQIASPMIQPGTYMDSTDSITYTMSQMVSKTQVKTGTQYDVYVLSSQGTVTLSGNVVSDWGTFPMRIRNASVVGEQWNRRSDLAEVHIDSRINGRLELYMAGSWNDFGNFSINQYQEFAPPREIYDFPVDVGESWRQQMTTYLWGDYYMENMGGDSFDDQVSTSVFHDCITRESKNGVMAYKIESEFQSGQGTLITWFSPDQRFSTYMTMQDVAVGVNTIHQSNSELTGFSLRTDPVLTINTPPASVSAGAQFSITGRTNGNNVSLQARFPDAPGSSTVWTATSSPTFTFTITAPTSADNTPQQDSPADIGSHGLVITANEDSNGDSKNDHRVVSIVVVTPGSNPTATRTPVPATPTRTPTQGGPTATRTPLYTPTPTRTVPPTDLPTIKLTISNTIVTAGDDFFLRALIKNPNASTFACDLYIVLQYADLYFFYPRWLQDIDNQPITLMPNANLNLSILEFEWPAGAGSGGPAYFFGLLTYPDTVDVIGTIDNVQFSFL